jgi:hypothetical protein
MVHKNARTVNAAARDLRGAFSAGEISLRAAAD